jgi:hypothetical protein
MPDDSTRFWAALAAELDRWSKAGRLATLFWRDDDAAAVTPALDRLVGLSADTGAPLGLAVIPADVSDDLVALPMPPTVRILQHGFAHVNHARGSGGSASELGLHRPLDRVLDDLREGKSRLEGRFGERVTPAVAPPWNTIADEVVAALPGLGFRAVAGQRSRPPA